LPFGTKDFRRRFDDPKRITAHLDVPNDLSIVLDDNARLPVAIHINKTHDGILLN
jgi:hypothetical protein